MIICCRFVVTHAEDLLNTNRNIEGGFVLLDWQVAAFFDEVLANGSDVKQAANWIMGDIAAHLKSIKLTISEAKLTPASLAELIDLIKDGTISGKIGKEVCACLHNFQCLTCPILKSRCRMMSAIF